MRPAADLIAAVESAIRERGGDASRGESTFRCPDPAHHANGDASPTARWNTTKKAWFCPVGNIGGGYVDLAKRLGIEGGNRRDTRTPSLAEFAGARCLPVEILETFGVRPVVHNGRAALRYPTALGVDRVKYLDGKRPRYLWAAKGKGHAHWYGLERAIPLLGSNGTAVMLYVVNGEPAVWACACRRVPAVCLCGEGAVPTPDLISVLKEKITGIIEPVTRVVYDTDVAGRVGAPKVVAALRGGGFVDVHALDLRPALPDVEKGDADDLHRRVGAELAAALAALPLLEREPREDDVVDMVDFFDVKDHFIPARLGARLMAESTIRLGHDRRLWRYANGVYRPDGDDWARQRTRELVGERFRRNHLEEVSAYLRAQLPSLGHEPPQQFINCTNGLLDWRTAVLHPHSPAVLTTNQIAVAWKPEAVAPRFESFLREVLPDDAVDLVEELVGYALYPGNPFRKAVMLLGPGGNGKSVLLRLITALLAKENVAAVPLQALGEDRFSAADLFGKLANICGDLDARAIERTDLFKQITGGDPIRAQHKFRDSFSFVSYALPFFSANEAPRTADQTDAWFDRWIIVPMERRFEGTPDEDTGLSEKLHAELAGILVRAVAGLRRLMERRRFAFPASVERARAHYRQTLDTVRAFITEQCHFDPDSWVDRARLYADYREWCKEGGRLALANTTFNAHLLQAYGSRLCRHKRVGRPGWMGLAAGPSPNGDVGDVGDGFSTLSNHVRAGARGKGEEVGNASPTSPASPNGGLANDPDDELTEWRTRP